MRHDNWDLLWLINAVIGLINSLSWLLNHTLSRTSLCLRPHVCSVKHSCHSCTLSAYCLDHHVWIRDLYLSQVVDFFLWTLSRWDIWGNCTCVEVQSDNKRKNRPPLLAHCNSGTAVYTTSMSSITYSMYTHTLSHTAVWSKHARADPPTYSHNYTPTSA